MQLKSKTQKEADFLSASPPHSQYPQRSGRQPIPLSLQWSLWVESRNEPQQKHQPQEPPAWESDNNLGRNRKVNKGVRKDNWEHLDGNGIKHKGDIGMLLLIYSIICLSPYTLLSPASPVNTLSIPPPPPPPPPHSSTPRKPIEAISLTDAGSIRELIVWELPLIFRYYLVG